MKRVIYIFLVLSSQYAFSQTPVYSENFESMAAGSRYFNIGATKVLPNGGVNNSKCVEVEYVRYESYGTPRYLHKHNITPGTEYTLCYDIFFDNDWTIGTGGKYHGLVPENTTSGCQPIEADGWSARVVFDNREPYLYTYHQDKDANCGDKSRNTTLQLDRNKWYSVSMHLKLNSADNVNDGFARLYINGQLVAQQTGREFRSVINNATQITKFYFCTFLGGSYTGAIRSIHHARFDNFGIFPGEHIRQSPGNDQQQNSPPTVQVTSPANNATFTLGETINLSASASDNDGDLDYVNFKINGGYYSQDRNAPFTGSFTPTEVGTYTIGARAFDTEGTSDEKEVTITVTDNTPDCAGVPGGDAHPDSSCNDGNPCTVNDVYDNDCNCVGQLVNPEAEVSGMNEECDSPGSILFSFDDTENRTDISFSIDGGNNYTLKVADNTGSATLDNITSGSYEIWSRWGNGQCPIFLKTVIIEADPEPEVEVVATDPHNADNTGTITFTFNDSPRWKIEFSMDGGVSYPLNVIDNVGSATFENVAPGTYNVWTRWGDDACPVDLGEVTINSLSKDCHGDFGGTASIDDCGSCSGGNTGKPVNDCVTSVEDFEKKSLFIYPNPTTGILNLSKEISWTLVDVLGDKQLQGESNQLSIYDYPPGVYFLLVEGKSYRIIKQ